MLRTCRQKYCKIPPIIEFQLKLPKCFVQLNYRRPHKSFFCKSIFVTVIGKYTSLFKVSCRINSEEELKFTASCCSSLREAEGQGDKGDSSTALNVKGQSTLDNDVLFAFCQKLVQVTGYPFAYSLHSGRNKICNVSIRKMWATKLIILSSLEAKRKKTPDIQIFPVAERPAK